MSLHPTGNSRPHGSNPGRSWIRMSALRRQMDTGIAYAQSLLGLTVPDGDESDEAPPPPEQQSPYPGHTFSTLEQCKPLRLEELLFWILDPYDQSYGTGMYSPVRCARPVAEYIRSHADWQKICYIEERTDGTIWLWRLKEWREQDDVRRAEQSQNIAELAHQMAKRDRYTLVMQNLIDHYKNRGKIPPDLALLMIQEWESTYTTDPMSKTLLDNYGWYEI